MKKLILLISIFVLLFTSCSNNVYIDESIDNPVTKEKIWKVGDSYFETADEAILYIMDHSQSRSLVEKTDDESRTIVLTRHVLSSESELGEDYKEYIEDEKLRGSITVPSTFTGNLTIDFNGKRYDFSNSSESFFVINGGDNIYIYNGTAVIYNEASHEPYAISVDTKTVTIDSHLIDDRRADPKALNVREKGSVVLTSSTGCENTSLKGDFKVDGKLSIENGVVYIEGLEVSKGSSLSITGGEIHSPHAYDDIVLPAIDEEEFEKNKGEHIYIHTWSTTPLDEEIVKKASCIEEGLKKVTYKCTECEATTTVKEVISETDHDHTREWITSDSTTHWRVCPVCSKVVDKAEHSFTAWGENEGENIWCRHCEVCGRTETNKHITHTLVHHPYTAGTCTTDGNVEYWECAICGEYYSDEAATTEMTEKETVIPHHTISSKWDYDIDSHWHVCEKDGNKVNKEAHSWSGWEEKVLGNAKYLYAECNECRAGKVCKDPEYLVYSLGFTELGLKNIESIPLGRFWIDGKEVGNGATVEVNGDEVTAVYEPYCDSNINYKAESYLYHNGVSVLNGKRNSEGYYTVILTLSDTTEHILSVQLRTGGGSLAFECHLYKSK